MSGTQVSSFPSMNELLAPRYLALQEGQALDTHQNALMQQQVHQQEIGAAETEMMGRASQALLAEPDLAKRAALYQQIVPGLQASGYAKNAPRNLPDESHLRILAGLAVPAADQYKQGQAGAAGVGLGSAYGFGPGAAAGGGGGVGAGGGGGATGVAGSGSRTRPEASGAPPAAGTPGAAVAQRVHDFWRWQGFTEEQTAGIMAGGPGSESDFTPSVLGDNGTSYGLYQHHGPRWEAMKARYGTANPTEAQQNEYAAWEIGPNGPPGLRGIADRLRTAKTPAEAATIWTRDFGRPGDVTEIDRRARGAGRYLGIYGGQSQQAATAPGAPPPNVQMGGPTPPPPGGRGSATPYPLTGGGIGSVLNPPAAVAGTGTGPLAAIETGRAQARAQPGLPGGVMTAGPGAPTAPGAAPSVELPPEPGWGSQVGTYNNAPAAAPAVPTPMRETFVRGADGSVQQAEVPTDGSGPPVPVAPPAAVVPAPTAPAAPAVPSPAAMPADLELDAHLLDKRDREELTPLYERMVRGLPGAAQLFQAEADKRQAFNVARRDKWQAQEHQKLEDYYKAQGETRAAETARLAKEAAQREVDKAAAAAKQAALPFQGNAADVQNRNILIDGTKTGKVDTVEYASAYSDYATEKKDAEGRTFKPDMSVYETPTHPAYGGAKGGREYGKSDVSQAAIAPEKMNTAMLGNQAALRNIDSALRELAAHPASVGVAGLQPEWLSQRTDPEGINLRADIADILSQTFHDRSGAAVTIKEAPRMQPFTPSQIDSAVALRTKLERMRTIVSGVLNDHYEIYGPKGGFRAMPGIEELLKTPAAPKTPIAPAATGGWSVKRVN